MNHINVTHGTAKFLNTPISAVSMCVYLISIPSMEPKNTSIVQNIKTILGSFQN